MSRKSLLASKCLHFCHLIKVCSFFKIRIGLSSVSAKFQPVVSHLHTEINVTSSTSSLNAAKLYSTLNAKDDENLKAQQEKVISLNRFLITNPYTIFVKENIKILKKKTPGKQKSYEYYLILIS